MDLITMKIYLSYAYVDDIPVFGYNEGWVTAFVGSLTIKLAQLLGRRNYYRLFVDKSSLNENEHLTPKIIEKIRSADLLLVVLSNGYVRSAWCTKVRSEFLSFVREFDKAKRIFVIEIEPITTTIPDELKDVHGFMFWERKKEGKGTSVISYAVINQNSMTYYELIDGISHQLVDELLHTSRATPDTDSTQAHIFISYQHEEKILAKKLSSALKNRGWSVWWDPEIRVGERFNDIIDKALRDAKCVIVMWSKRSVKSDYVKDEAAFALNRKKLIPIAIEEVDLPFRFEGIHTAQLINWDGSDSFPGFQEFIADLVNRFG